jgi:hypothetical protein
MAQQLTPEELKTLQVFAYYCRSNGADRVYTTIYLSACSRDWEDGVWYSNQISRSIESYDKIDELVEKLVDDESITDKFTECDGSQRIEVEIDCKERILNIYAYETVYGSEPHGLSYDLDEIESEFGEETLKAVEELFEHINGREGRVDFSGGGDDGYIEDKMIIDNEQVDIPNLIESMLYSMISSNFAGWENNEGAQGSWLFDPVDKSVIFDFNYNTEEEVSVDFNYELTF